MSITDDLRQVRQFIAGGWTQGACARNSVDESVSVQSEDAVKFCLQGGCLKVINGDLAKYGDITHPIFGKVGTLTDWNDAEGRTQQEVLDLLDSIIMELV